MCDDCRQMQLLAEVEAVVGNRVALDEVGFVLLDCLQQSAIEDRVHRLGLRNTSSTTSIHGRSLISYLTPSIRLPSTSTRENLKGSDSRSSSLRNQRVRKRGCFQVMRWARRCSSSMYSIGAAT